jgi:putative flippase GtrA
MMSAASLWQRLRIAGLKSRLVPFAFVGGLSSGTTIGLTWVLSVLFHLELRLSALLGYAAGMICSYALNHLYVFQDAAKRPAAVRTIFFIGVNAASAVAYAQASQFLDAALPRLLALSVAVGCSTVINYLGYRYLVFAR